MGIFEDMCIRRTLLAETLRADIEGGAPVEWIYGAFGIDPHDMEPSEILSELESDTRVCVSHEPDAPCNA